MKRMIDDRVDVCLVFDPSEAALAEAVGQRLADAGLTSAPCRAEVTAGEDFASTVRQTVNASRSMAFLMSRAAVANQVVPVFAGAAWAVELPIFVLRNNVRPSDYSPFFKRFPAYALWSGFPRLIKDLDRVADQTPA